jgi:predicted small secreted protein
MLNKLVLLLAAAGIALTVTGCNTIEGAGKDIKAAGGAIEKSAEKTKPY